ncbi:tripartite tricarboxylate transporter TctB family protein [Campylobacter sp. MIT 99-7217]|uniref:tripartite tricarboxylate transporter TctB family protein n=1 Tax=Campylobacter sp. MIT 99-7217 TaxID=535091 RepID=UPI0011578DFC|nr:tripartite tricarboxylate transporter TctB family protein [Campylobacter sp. MIT 99-7217]TQR30648.1 tripartite tricarboxylate transporter TctB family protein [Campylobacter sp. MIT 99-7217]
MISTRILASILIVLSLAGIYIGWGITTPFSYEPLGPRPFPIGTLILLTFCSFLLFFFAEDTNVKWPDTKLLKKLVALVLSFFIFAFCFEYLGFIICSGLLMFVMALLFGTNIIKALIFSALASVILYYCFDDLLQITLPSGYIFG